MSDVKNQLNEKLDKTFSPKGKKIFVVLIALGVLAVALILVGMMPQKDNASQEDLANMPTIEDVNVEGEKANLDKATKEIDVVDDEEGNEKMVSLSVEDYGRANPFLPSSEAISNSMKYGFDLMAPPETLSDESSEAAKVITTKVSGIMYNPKGSSAILNIEGSDYLVRSGDYINRYRVLAIAPDMVTVQLGKNVYKAKVGEVITEGESVNYNTVYNLPNKFGGARK